jgi:hypothetical protein
MVTELVEAGAAFGVGVRARLGERAAEGWDGTRALRDHPKSSPDESLKALDESPWPSMRAERF